MAPGTPGLAAVIAAFGSEVRGPTAGSTGRNWRRSSLRIRTPVAGWRGSPTRWSGRSSSGGVRGDGRRVVVNDIPLLRTLALAADYHLVVGIGAAEETRVERLVDRGLAEADARARIRSQISDEQRRALSDVWVDNDGPADDLRERMTALWAERLVPFRENLAARRRASRTGPAVLLDPDPRWPVLPPCWPPGSPPPPAACRSSTSGRRRSRDCRPRTSSTCNSWCPIWRPPMSWPGRWRRGVPAGARELLDNPHPIPGARVGCAGRLGQAAARQRRPRPQCQPPPQGEGCAEPAARRAVSGLAPGGPGSPAEYLRVKRGLAADMRTIGMPGGMRKGRNRDSRPPQRPRTGRRTGWTVPRWNRVGLLTGVGGPGRSPGDTRSTAVRRRVPGPRQVERRRTDGSSAVGAPA